jgi:hypothetical protein
VEPPAPDYDNELDEEEEFEESRGRAPVLIGLLLLVLIVGGAAAYAYAERDRLFALLDFSVSGESGAAVGAFSTDGAAPDSSPAAAEAEKRPDRLTNGTEAPPLAPSPPPQAESPPNVPADAPAQPLPSEEAAGLDAERQTAALDQPGQSIVAQRAIYYFQGAEGTPGRATPGNVTWSQTTRDGAPAVQATLHLDGQEVATTVTVYKNSDPSLPASHLVEVQFSGQLGTSPIQRVPALVVKQTEQARGQPLNAAAVSVTNELFWIALSDEAAEVARNLQLLREGSWFDIPILFEDGTRALLTFEKGIPGDQIFETTLSAWNSG